MSSGNTRVDNQLLPDRSIHSEERPGLPYHLLLALQRTVGIDADEAAAYTEAEAKQRIADRWQRIADDSAEPD